MSEVLEYLEDHRGAMLSDLEEFVTRETPSLDKARTDDFTRYLADYAAGLGGEVKVLPAEERGDHVRVSWGERAGERPVLVLGHFDTVWPAGTLERMPFAVEEGIGRGPGIFDMKGGLVQGFWAIRALRETGGLDRPVVFFCNSDEETHSMTSRPLIEEEARQAAVALVLESSGKGRLTTARKGVGWFEVEVTGRESHAGTNPFGGVSAVDELARLTLELHGHNDRETGTTVNVGVVEGGTRANVVPGRAWAQVNLRVVSEEEAERMTRVIHGLKPHNEGAKVEVTGGIKRPPMERTESTAALFEHARKLAAELGFELEEQMSGGGSDGNFCAAVGTPVLDGLGAVGGGAHAEHEHVYVETMPRRAALVARLIQTV
jgi:glutamate carboxypeptidase